MSDVTPEAALSTKHYFVDEAGDPVLFDAKGRVLVGTEGCSRYFAVGLLDVADAAKLSAELTKLRAELLADPYFKNVPSMQPEANKTALYFHAKDDLPEVRREVFKLLPRHELKFSAVVRDKQAVLDYVRGRNERDVTYRYKSDELYDHIVRRLFKERLHKQDGYSIRFAIREQPSYRRLSSRLGNRAHPICPRARHFHHRQTGCEGKPANRRTSIAGSGLFSVGAPAHI